MGEEGLEVRVGERYRIGNFYDRVTAIEPNVALASGFVVEYDSERRDGRNVGGGCADLGAFRATRGPSDGRYYRPGDVITLAPSRHQRERQVWLRLADGRWINELGSYVDADWINNREKDSEPFLLLRGGFTF